MREFSNPILFGDGWHLMECQGNNSFIWTTNESEIWLEHDIDKIVLTFDCFSLNTGSVEIIKDGNLENTVHFVGGFNTIEIPIRGAKNLKLKTPVFVPKQIITNSDDPRSLGMRLCEVKVDYAGITHSLPIETINTKRYLNLRNQVELITKLQSEEVAGSRKFNLAFDKVYCISTLNDFARRKKALEQYTKYHINFEFISAVDSQYISSPAESHLSKEEMSLCLTNKLCLETAKLNGYESVVIMEDDFEFKAGWLNGFVSFIQNVPNDWEFLYLGRAKWWNGITDKKVISVNEFVDRVIFGAGCGAHFVVIKQSLYNLCIGLLGQLMDGADVCYGNAVKDGTHKCYSPKTSLADSLSCPDKHFVHKVDDFSLTDYFPSRLLRR